MQSGKKLKQKRYNYQTAFFDYRRDVDSPESFPVYASVLRDFFYGLNRSVIVDKYEWKIPFFGGYLRISKKPYKTKDGEDKWWYYWAWDKTRNIMHWPKANVWTFQPVEGRCRRRNVGEKDIGAYGLWGHINEMGSNYDVMIKKRRIKRISHKDFLESLKDVD